MTGSKSKFGILIRKTVLGILNRFCHARRRRAVFPAKKRKKKEKIKNH